MSAFDPERTFPRASAAERAEIRSWWGALDPEARAQLVLLGDPNEDDAGGDDVREWSGVPIVLDATTEDPHEAREDKEARRDRLEYILGHDVAVFLDARVYRICRRHPAARAVLREGHLPVTFACPLGRGARCPMLRIRAAAHGRAVWWRPREDPRLPR